MRRAERCGQILLSDCKAVDEQWPEPMPSASPHRGGPWRSIGTSSESLKTDPRGQPHGARSTSRAATLPAGASGGWREHYSAVIQSEIVRTGTKACRFEIRPGDHVSQGLRAELRDWYNAPFEDATPGTASPPICRRISRRRQGVGVVLAQWHDQAELGDPSGKPPLAIRYLDGALRFTGAFSEVASPGPGQAVCVPRNAGRRP